MASVLEQRVACLRTRLNDILNILDAKFQKNFDEETMYEWFLKQLSILNSASSALWEIDKVRFLPIKSIGVKSMMYLEDR
jgi:hypothetical protein